MSIYTKKTQRAKRWLKNYAELSFVTVKVDEKEERTYEKTKICEVIQTNLKIKSKNGEKEIPINLNVYQKKDSDTKIREFIQGYRFKKNTIVVYLALKFNNEKNQKVICSLWGYKADNVEQVENQQEVKINN